MPIYKLEQWRDRVLAGMNASLKARENDPIPRQLDDAMAQRAKEKRRSRAIHARIANRRKDFRHKLSMQIVREYGFICIGNANSRQAAQTRMAKSMLDAGWSMFRNMCAYKAIGYRAYYKEQDEAFSTQDSSVCDARTGPKGLSGLEIREWVCSSCGTLHQRDRHSAKIIIRRGRATLAERITVSSGR